MKKVQAINNRQLAITKSNALFDLITPAGISLTAVRGFFASKFLSSQRLKAMAAERAKIMQRMTRMNNFIKSITMHVIFYQCFSQLCPLAFHFNITNINIVAPCTASMKFYQLGRNEDILFYDPCCILGNQLQQHVLVLPFVMLNEHVATLRK